MTRDEAIRLLELRATVSSGMGFETESLEMAIAALRREWELQKAIAEAIGTLDREGSPKRMYEETRKVLTKALSNTEAPSDRTPD